MWFTACAVTDKGPVHLKNQDNFAIGSIYSDIDTEHICVCEQGEINRYAVCDGISAYPNASFASALGCRILMEHQSQGTLDEQLYQALLEADRQISHLPEETGTTAALYTDGIYAAAANLGDSRVYLFREGYLQQLTTDHNQATMFQQIGIDGQALQHSGMNPHALTQYLGLGREEILIEPTISESIQLCDSDCFLLCSDGLTSHLSDDAIKEVMQKYLFGKKGKWVIRRKSYFNLKKLTEKLVQTALDAGTRDNITVMLCRCGN